MFDLFDVNIMVDGGHMCVTVTVLMTTSSLKKFATTVDGPLCNSSPSFGSHSVDWFWKNYVDEVNDGVGISW